MPSDVDEAEFEMLVEGPEGMSLAAMDEALQAIDREVRAVPGVQLALLVTGAGGLARVNQGNGYIRIAPHDERTVTARRLWEGLRRGDPLAAFRGNYTQRDVMQQVRQRMRKFSDMRISIRNIPGFNIGGGNFDIDFVLRGPDLEALARYGDELRRRAVQIGGMLDLNTTLRLDRPELRVQIDRERAADLRVDTEQIATALRLMVGGDQEVSRFRDPSVNEDYDVQLRLREADRKDLRTISRLYVSRAGAAASEAIGGAPQVGLAPGGGLVRLDNLMKIVATQTAPRVDRSDRQREVRLRASVAPGYGLADRIEALRGAVAAMNLPPGYSSSVSGRASEFEKTFKEFLWVFLLAVIFMYMILASQFESLIHPLTILLALPLSVPFALFSLWYTGNTLNLYSALGILVLFGIVKKNSILADRPDERAAPGRPRPRERDHRGQSQPAPPDPHDHLGPGGGHDAALGGHGARGRGAPRHSRGGHRRPVPLPAPHLAGDPGGLLAVRGSHARTRAARSGWARPAPHSGEWLVAAVAHGQRRRARSRGDGGSLRRRPQRSPAEGRRLTALSRELAPDSNQSALRALDLSALRAAGRDPVTRR